MDENKTGIEQELYLAPETKENPRLYPRKILKT